MLKKYLQIETLSIVFVGEFNPVILQPFWLSNKKLIREDEAKTANVSIIHNEVVKFDLDWVQINISKQRCEFKTNKSPYFEATKDLAISIFRILKETPITSLGINEIFHISLFNEDSYFRFGNNLAPLDIWTDSLKDPKLMQLEILEKVREDNQNGRYRVRISPSDQNISFGVAINFNDHYDLDSGDKGTNMEIVKKLEDNWENSKKRSRKVTENLLKNIFS